jgi:carbon starvation protein
MNNTLVAIIIGALTIYLGYNFYARRIDREVIGANSTKATPARLYMDGVDFVPTSRNVLYGYHFKSIAAAGPIVGAITAGALWGWVPSIIWLVIGVVFMGWASDYSAIVVSVRNDGNSLSATAHRLIAPRTRQILLLFIFFYLVLVAGAFGNIVAGVLVVPTVPLGVIALALLGLLGGQMLYRMRSDLLLVTGITVGGTLLCVLLNADANGFVAQMWAGFNKALDGLAPNGIATVLDPTRGCAPPAGQSGPCTADQLAAAQSVKISVSFVFWLLALFAFCYAGAIMPIWRYAQPVNYIGFWITALTIVFGGLGAFLAFFLRPDIATFKLSGYIGFSGPPAVIASGALQPLWPMLFVTIACGAISGWHALIGSVGTARQIENETDMLPVGGGAMFSEFALGLLALLALATATTPTAGAPQFASGIGGFLSVFGLPLQYGTAIGFTAFVVIVITVVQLVFRIMRVTLAEGLGDRSPIFRNVHVGTLISMLATFLLVITGTWVYIWQLFGASNQLMASLSLLVVTVWLAASRRNPTYAAIPTLFMYITTMAATIVTAYNLYATVFIKQLGQPGHEIAVIGSLLTIAIAIILFVAAIFIGIDGVRAYQRYRETPLEPVPAPGAARA